MPAFAELLHMFRFGKRKVVGVAHIQRARPCSARPQVEQHADNQPSAFALGALNDPVKRIECLDGEILCRQVRRDSTSVPAACVHPHDGRDCQHRAGGLDDGGFDGSGRS